MTSQSLLRILCGLPKKWITRPVARQDSSPDSVLLFLENSKSPDLDFYMTWG